MPVKFYIGGMEGYITIPAQSDTQTTVVVSAANTPYNVQPTDSLIEFDESAGTLVQANLPTNPFLGEKHTFVWYKWTSTAPPPVINGNGNSVVPYAPGAQTSGASAASTVINSNGGSITYQWDGTIWMLIAQS